MPHTFGARVIEVGVDSLTLWVDASWVPLSKPGWEYREFPVVDMLARGDIHEWAGDQYAYGLAEVRPGDLVDVGVLLDLEDRRVYVSEISIRDRPNGYIPSSRRPGFLTYQPPNTFVESPWGPYHRAKNAVKDIRNGIPVSPEVLRETKLLDRRPPAPKPPAQ